MFQYDMLARSIKEGQGFRWYTKADIDILRPYYSQFLDLEHLNFPEEGLITTFRAPGYPFFLAIIYWFVSNTSHFIAARLVHAFFAAILAVLVALIAYNLGLSQKASILSAVGTSLYPILLFYPVGLASENLYIFLGCLLFFFIFQCGKRSGWHWIITAGLCAAVTILTRSIFSVFVLLSAVWIGYYSIYKKRAAIAFLLIAFGLTIPWSVRNSILMHKPAFVENNASYNLFIGYHPEGDGGFVSEIAILPMSILDDGERDTYCFDQAINFIREDPMEALRRVFFRWFKFIGPEDREFFYFYSNNLVGRITQPWLMVIYSLLFFPWLATLFLGLLGLFKFKNQKIFILAILFFVGYTFPHLLILAEPRFHLALVPILMPFAVYGWRNRSILSSGKFFRKTNAWFPVTLILVAGSFITGFFLNLPKLISILGENGNKLFFSY